MDHLKTSEERRERWYSKLAPRYVSIKNPSCAQDVLLSSSKEEDEIYGIPFTLLKDHPNLLSNTIEKHGFAIVSGVLSEDDCRESLEKAWDYIEAASYAEERIQHPNKVSNISKMSPPIQRSNPLSHSSEYFPHSLEGGMLPFYGSGHSTFAWSIRSHPHVHEVFKYVHDGCTNLISSLDGIVLWHASQPITDAGWFHVDQNLIAKPNKECIQGLVNLLPVTTNTGGNVVVAESHRFFPHHYTNANHNSEFYKARLGELGNEDWMEIDPNDAELLNPNSILTCLLNPGDMILWDSRTVHCSNPRSQEATNNQVINNESLLVNESAHGLLRAAAAVCMMPASNADASIFQQRRVAVDQKRTLTHWANKVAPLGDENSEQASMESRRIQYVLEYEKATSTKIILDYQDLSLQQKGLVGSWKEYGEER